MSLVKYECSWVGIDGGREGLWAEPIWLDVLRIIAAHQNEHVYDRHSPIYTQLESAYPKEAWRSSTADGGFRPLFRDYPNSWTRLGVVSLVGQRFAVTPLGKAVIAGTVSKTELLLNMFNNHVEQTSANPLGERPFVILACGFLESPRPLATAEVYWAIMKNYRPTQDSLSEVIKRKLPFVKASVLPTPYRRLRNMLSLLRAAGAISSSWRASGVVWSKLNQQLLSQLAERSNL